VSDEVRSITASPDADDLYEPPQGASWRFFLSHLLLTDIGFAMRVLIVEDDVKMASLIRSGLHEEGIVGDTAVSGEGALGLAAGTEYDAIVLDIMLPGIDGFETCRRLRSDGIWTPVLMLTARDAVEDRVKGLDPGR
jgi:CheY-like chemotaxis protein